MELDNETIKQIAEIDDRIDNQTSPKYKSVGEALEGIGTTVAGMASGAVSATLGLPTDIVATGAGIKDAILANKGERMDAFSKGFTEVSKKNMGSEYYKENFNQLLDSLIENPVLKEDSKSGFSAGQFGGVGGVISKAPTIARGIIAQKETAREILSSLGLSSKAMKNVNVDNMSVDAAINLAKKLKVARAKLYGSDERGNIGNAVMAMTAKREPSPVRNLDDAVAMTQKTPKEVPPLEIGSSKFALEGKLKSNLTLDSLQLFEDKAKGATAGSSEANKLIGSPIKDGEKVGIRKNLNSRSLDGEKGVLQTIHQNNYNGKALSYQPYATVENVTFNVNQSHRRRIASKAKGLAVPESSAKFNMASVDGKYVSDKNLLLDGYETEISFNPAQGHLFIDVNTGQAVKSADTATVVGDRVFANGVTYWKKSDAPKPLDASDGTKLTGEVRYKFRRGGLMARN